MSVSAVIFDMDGLMLDSEAIYRRAWKAAACDCGYELPDAIFTRTVGIGARQSERVIEEHFGPAFPISRFRECYPRHQERLFSELTPALKPGLLDLLTWLEHRAIPKCVATTTPRPDAIPRLQKTNLLGRFASITTGDEVEHGKPAPDLFLLAAERLNIDPKRCLVLEDSEPGVLGANRAGMKVIMVPDLVQPRAEIQALVAGMFTTLSAAQSLIASLVEN